jgi:hypothetical protein
MTRAHSGAAPLHTHRDADKPVLAPLFRVDGASLQRGRDRGTEYAVWRVLSIATGNLICAFYGGASFHAASSFCEQINADPEWRAAAAEATTAAETPPVGMEPVPSTGGMHDKNGAA